VKRGDDPRGSEGEDQDEGGRGFQVATMASVTALSERLAFVLQFKFVRVAELR
jgi:hypothetical protein